MKKIESTPAPGDYDPQKAVKIIQDSSPKYSFGIKAQTERINLIPGMSHNNILQCAGFRNVKCFITGLECNGVVWYLIEPLNTRTIDWSFIL